MKAINTIIFALIALPLFSQTVVESPSVTSPSASAGSFGKYAEVPVSLYTGTPTVAIPMYTVSEGPLSADIGLSYHAAGNRVAEVGSAVGLGWTLNAGGGIFRTVRNVPDDKNTTDLMGYFSVASSVLTAFSKKAAEGKRDSEPDIYTLSAPGLGSLKFTYDKNLNVQTFPRSKVKIQRKHSTIGTLVGFEVIGTDGTIYWFGYDLDEYTNGQVPGNYIFQKSPKTYYESFHLERIISSDGRHEIDFEYENSDYEYKILKPCTAFLSPGSNDYETCDDGFDDLTIEVRDKVLKSITTSTTTITLDHFERLDLDPGQNSNLLGQTTASLPLGIERINIQEGKYDMKYELTHGYFNDNNGTGRSRKRLRLDQVQLVSNKSPYISEPPYKFDYQNNGTFFPHRLSPRIDRWGYYNGQSSNEGKDNLIPSGTLVKTGGTTYSYGASNRSTSPYHMLFGQLTRVTYPTQGYTSFTFEGNKYQKSSFATLINDLKSCDGGGVTCCNNQDNSINKVLTSQMIETGKIMLYQDVLTNSNSCFFNSKMVYLRIYDLTSGIGAPIYNINLNSSSSDQISIDLEDISGLIAGHNYKFEIESTNCRARLTLTYTGSYSDMDCGGLRIKQILTHDDINTNNDIIKTYKYEDATESTLTSGIIYNHPEFGFSLENGALYSSESIKPLGGFDGYHIGYQRVIVEHNGNGSEEHIYHTDHQENVYEDYPIAPQQYRPNIGVEKQSAISSQGGLVIQSAQTFLDSSGILKFGLQGTMFRAANLAPFGALSNKYPYTEYTLYTDHPRVVQTEAMSNNVLSTTTFEYPAGPGWNFEPIKTNTWNSDEKKYSTITKYSSQYHYSAALRDSLRGRNILSIPYEILHQEDGQTISGGRTKFAWFKADGTLGSGAGADPYPRYQDAYQRTWTNGVLSAGSWSTEKTINSYTSDGLLKSAKQKGWNNTTYTYNPDKLLSSKTYDTHTSSYVYVAGTRLINYTTAVDGSIVTHDYDNLMRLTSKIQGCNGTSMDYLYSFSSTSGTRSYIQTTSTYPADPLGKSDITSIVGKQFMDGLGRTIQSVGVAQTQDGTKDIVQAMEYDKYGRTLRSYDPKAFTSTGNYVAPLALWPHTTTYYEASPLSRVDSTRHTDWHATSYTYGANTSGDNVILDHTVNSYYPVNQLIKSTIIDPNNNRLISFRDKKGRSILSRRTNSSGGDKVDTYTIYDGLDRPTTILPPQTSLSDTELIFTNQYDKEGHVIRKKVPGMAATEYWYNTKDLLGAYRNALLEDQSLWYAYEYDSRGREVAAGFYDTAPPTSGSFSNITPTIKLSETIFGTTSFERDKVKTSKTKVLGRSDWLESTLTYNTCGTVASSIANNHLDLTKDDVTTITYDGAHNPVYSHHTHSTTSHSLNTTLHSSYDHTGRSDSTHFAINGTTIQGSASTYDHKNQLTQYRIGLPTGNVLQQVDYAYRDNGMLTTVNKGIGYQANDLYSYELAYDTPYTGTTPMVRENGDVINTVWQTIGGNEKIYSYEYDYLDRLKSATYKEAEYDDKYNTAYVYEDQRGNIKSITRQGYHLEDGNLNAGQIDNLRLYYNGNELTHVNDYTTGSKAVEGYYKNGSGNYEYDDNGNLNRDPIKDYRTYYNHLNLPDSIIYDDGKRMEFTYDAGGGLLQKRIYLNTTTCIEKRDYINDIEYVNGDIEAIYTPEGRAYNEGYMPDTLYVIDSIYGIRAVAAKVILSNGSVKDHPSTTVFEMDGDNSLILMPGFKVETASTLIAQIQNNTASGWRAEYFVSDHLGNTRLVYSDLNNDHAITANEILQENHYYPFGLKQNGPWQQSKDAVAYQYNGIEHLDAFGLDLNMAPYRMLDPSIGRWLSIDPKGSAIPSLSLYQSVGNNPIRNADPNGDLFFAVPKISFNGGFSFGMEVGIGVPGMLSASVSGTVGANGGNWSIQGSAYGIYAGYGSNGAFAGIGYEYGGVSGGVNFGKGGASVSLGYGGSKDGHGIFAGLNYGSSGLSIAANTSYIHQFYLNPINKNYLRSVANTSDPNESLADNCTTCDAIAKSISATTDMSYAEAYAIVYWDTKGKYQLEAAGYAFDLFTGPSGEGAAFSMFLRSGSALKTYSKIRNRVPKGELWYDPIKKIFLKGGQWISDKVQYLKFGNKGTKSLKPPTTKAEVLQPAPQNPWHDRIKAFSRLFGGDNP